MNDFPSFMKNKQNLVPAEGQNTEDIKGYFFNGNDGNQVVYRTCYSDQISKQHIHPFDEYMVCIAGQYIGYIEEEEHILNPGDELYIPKGNAQWGKCKAGTRTIHVSGGQRIKEYSSLDN